MDSLVRQRLSDDHLAVDRVLRQLRAALDNKDIAAAYSKLDLLWARLAVHIRAEHLHLFPAVLNRLSGSTDNVGAPELNEAKAAVENLRADHEFFMTELARAVDILRELPTAINSDSEATLKAVRGMVLVVGKQLANHNETEENQIYRWVSMILTEEEQKDLATQINAELENHPPRFATDVWTSTHQNEI